ncbi:MAG: hypothetical protein ABSF50_21775 [Burkholderiaceae bacterium]|jgi:hypothetical protein
MKPNNGRINRAIPDADFDAIIADFVKRIPSFNGRVLGVMASISQFGPPDPIELQRTHYTFLETFKWEGLASLLPRHLQLGIGQSDESGKNLRRKIGDL